MLGLSEYINFDLYEGWGREGVNFLSYYHIFETSTSLGQICYSPAFFPNFLSYSAVTVAIQMRPSD